MADVRLASNDFTFTANPNNHGPAMNIPAVPASINWGPVAAFLTSLGIDLDDVAHERPVAAIGWNAIECDIYARNPDGNFYVANDGKTAAMHHICIPIVHGEGTS